MTEFREQFPFTESKPFDLGAVISASSGILMCPIGDVYQILNFMTDDNLFTHQLPRAFRECAPWLYRWHPHLPDADTLRGVTPVDYLDILAGLKKQLGDTLPVWQIPKDDHVEKDPVIELEEMVGKDRVIPIIIDGG